MLLSFLSSTKCRFKSSTPSNILKGAPDFCTVYVISKGRISSVRSAARTAPHASPLLRHIQILHDENARESEISSKCMVCLFEINYVCGVILKLF